MIPPFTNSFERTGSRPASVAGHLRATRQGSVRRGFALIIALVLMGFLLLVMLSLGMMVNVDVAGGALSGKKREAEQNALLGLQVALGQLQQLLGPDQRVSARADILAADGNLSAIKHPYWTGVWARQQSADPDEGEVVQLLNFLVSGNEDGLSLNARNANLDEAESVKIVEALPALTLDGTGAEAVFVKKVWINGNDARSGAYGYWVADEGIKAKANLRPATGTPSGIENFRMLAPQQAGIAQMEGMSWFNKADSRLDFLSDVGSLGLLKNASAKGHFHDLTFYSYGVLSNVKDGGLKEDLTVGLASGSALPEGQIFGPVAGAGNATVNPGGPLWAQLRSWVNTELGSSMGGARGTLPVRKSTDDRVGYAPLVAGWELYNVPVFNSSGREIYMCFMPVVVLWNPYDVPLQNASYKVRFFFSTLDTDTGPGFVYRPPAASSSRRIMQFDIELLGDSSQQHRVNVGEVEFEILSVSLDPGQSKVFSMTANVDIAPASGVANSDYTAGQVISLEESFPSGYHYRLPLRKTGSGAPAAEQAVLPDLDAGFLYKNGSFPRAVAMELLRLGGGAGSDEILSAGFLLKHGESTTGTMPTAQMHSVSGASSPLASAARAHAMGMKGTRSWTKLPDRSGTHNSAFAGRWLKDYNPRGTNAGPALFWYANGGLGVIDRYTNAHASFFITTEYGDANQETELEGLGYSADGAVEKTVLFEAPYGLDHLFSIGQLMHAPLYHYADGSLASNEGSLGATTDFYKHRLKNARFDNLTPAYAIGNSRAHVAILPQSTYRDWSGLTRTGDAMRYYDMQGLLYDYSYLLNDALWDGYFFSTLKAGEAEEDEEPEYKPLNPRMVVVHGGEDALPSLTASAGRLMVDGAFNINSTSQEAWRALLASYFGEPVALSGGGSSSGNSAPLPRLTMPAAAGLDTSEAESVDAADNVLSYTGYRRLGAGQIDALAEQIVKQVRLRGPFTSLSEFVNRALLASDANDRHLHGAIGSALDATKINDALRKDTDSEIRSRPASISASNWFGEQTHVGNTTESVPGWLTQADVLAKLGSVISARSDTFVVRAYGEAGSTDGSSSEPGSRAWCEAVVQRLPEFVDSSGGQEPHTHEDALSSINKQFGRRFVVVSFRWLSAEDL